MFLLDMVWNMVNASLAHMPLRTYTIYRFVRALDGEYGDSLLLRQLGLLLLRVAKVLTWGRLKVTISTQEIVGLDVVTQNSQLMRT
jgi:hypothetical protein